MVLGADAVVDPLAVVVEAVDTLVADVAMPRVSGADHLAGRTQDVGLEFFDELEERDLLGAPHEARLLLHGDDEENEREDKESSEDRKPAVGVNVCYDEARNNLQGWTKASNAMYVPHDSTTKQARVLLLASLFFMGCLKWQHGM